ncbi:MAG: DHHA1 domain-containing protein, partial [Erysipelotrichaceae bacterium]
VRSIVEEKTSLKKELQTLETKMMQEKANALLSQTEEINGLRVLLATFENVEGGALKAMADDLRSKMESCLVFLIAKNNDALVFVAASDKAGVSRGVHCGNLVKLAASLSDGKGGGRPDLAQAGGKDVSKLEEVLENIKLTLNSL